MSYKKHVRGVNNTTKMLISEQIGYGMAGTIAGLDATGTGNKVFATGSAFAGMPSLMSGAGNVLGSMKMLDYSKNHTKKHRKR